MAAGAISAPLIIPIIHLQTHRPKNHIETRTPVSIQSDTPGVLIFYTLDGSKPALVQKGLAGTSRKYSEPILLPAGRVSIKAVAVSSDGRESSTVTKVFFVQSVDLNMEDTDLQNNEQSSPDRSGSPAGPSLRPAGPRFLKSRLDPMNSQCSLSERPSVLKTLSSTETSRIQRETDFLRCAQCLSPRPSDPFARFCAHCGATIPPLPQQRLAPAEGGQMLRCVFCNSLVPVNTQTCLICEASVHQQLQPQAASALQDHTLCVACGWGNPAHISRCLTCETPLQTVTPKIALPAGGRMLSCSRCKRVNNSSARFCDWCGSKPTHTTRCVTCHRCGATGHPYAFYCTACGGYLEAPPTSSCEMKQPTPNQASGSTSSDVTWKAKHSSGPASRVNLAPPTVDQTTQTTGLYFPSATELHKREQQRFQVNTKQVPRHREPLLTAISPGRGYWRKQLDHVCSHLRSYAQNNSNFRTLLGEPRLGRMVSAVIQDDQYEVSMTISFMSVGQVDKQSGPESDAAEPAGSSERVQNLSSVTEKSAENSIKSVTKSPKLNLTHKPSVKNVQLLKELGAGGGQISIIQQLLDQGADPSCCDANGQHALLVAVVNGHHDVVPVLVQQGADVDHHSGLMKNTALHEAAAQGSEGLQCARVLLSCKASVRKRNSAGQTAYDVAVTSGCNDMVSLLAAQTGLSLLGQLEKPKFNLDIF